MKQILILLFLHDTGSGHTKNCESEDLSLLRMSQKSQIFFYLTVHFRC